jgi:hypothetical protein
MDEGRAASYRLPLPFAFLLLPSAKRSAYNRAELKTP